MMRSGVPQCLGRSRRAELGGRPKAAVPTQSKIQIPCWPREVRDFHRGVTKGLKAPNIDSSRANPRWMRRFAESWPEVAPNPVTGLWTGCTRLKKQIVAGACFRLTENLEGVQQDRSLTAS